MHPLMLPDVFHGKKKIDSFKSEFACFPHIFTGIPLLSGHTSLWTLIFKEQLSQSCTLRTLATFSLERGNILSRNTFGPLKREQWSVLTLNHSFVLQLLERFILKPFGLRDLFLMVCSKRLKCPTSFNLKGILRQFKRCLQLFLSFPCICQLILKVSSSSAVWIICCFTPCNYWIDLKHNTCCDSVISALWFMAGGTFP